MKSCTFYRNDLGNFEFNYTSNIGESIVVENISEDILTKLVDIETYLDGFKTKAEIDKELLEQEIEILKSEISEVENQRTQAFEFVRCKATVEEKLNLIDVFPEFKKDTYYKPKNEFKFGSKIYSTLKENISTVENPSESPDLYKEIGDSNISEVIE